MDSEQSIENSTKQTAKIRDSKWAMRQRLMSTT